MTSLPPPLTISTRSRPSVNTSRNSMSDDVVKGRHAATLHMGGCAHRFRTNIEH